MSVSTSALGCAIPLQHLDAMATPEEKDTQHRKEQACKKYAIPRIDTFIVRYRYRNENIDI
jgi:hypothetical protein